MLKYLDNEDMMKIIKRERNRVSSNEMDGFGKVLFEKSKKKGQISNRCV